MVEDAAVSCVDEVLSHGGLRVGLVKVVGRSWVLVSRVARDIRMHLLLLVFVVPSSPWSVSNVSASRQSPTLYRCQLLMGGG